MRNQLSVTLAAVAFTAITGAVLRATPPDHEQAPESSQRSARIKRGAYLVRIMGCNHCHTPYKVGPQGPEPDMARALTGHPSDMAVPAPPAPIGPWIWHGAATNTAFAGPWGVSFAANLTPDPDTGLGRWTEEMFIATMRTGRHQGKGRPILPPMPYENLGNLDDEDIRSLFAFLQSLTPVQNRVPAPIDSAEETR